MFSSNASQVSSDANYIEDVFSTWLYTGNGSTQTINNGIDLAGKGGLVWLKARSQAYSHFLFDTQRGANNYLISNSNGAQGSGTTLTSFNADGFSLQQGSLNTNNSGVTFASWTFREQPKFFDVVTYTGDGAVSRFINHNLESSPGFIVVKRTDATGNWPASIAFFDVAFRLNSTLPSSSDFAPGTAGDNGYPNSPQSTSTQFLLSSGQSGNADVNASGGTYVAYLFAHNAGGFGLSGEDNVISCGSYTTVANAATVNLGWEPQFILHKRTDIAGNWEINDITRGLTVTGSTEQRLFPNSTAAESATNLFGINATGFTSEQATGSYIYIAIRRGPMKVPESGTSVLGLNARTGTGANATVTGSAGVTDLAIIKNRGVSTNWVWVPRLAGTGYMSSNQTDVEIAASTNILQANPWDVMDGIKVGSTSNLTNASGNTFINYLIDRAPGFMDVVCDTGTGSTHTIAHNLTVIPEFYIRKDRTGGGSNWVCYHKDLGATQAINLNQDVAAYTLSTAWNNTAPTASVFTVGTAIAVNSGVNYVTYLFASCPGVSKVGSYTGNGGSQTINCGFTAGARFVLIKRVDGISDWIVFDTARGIVAGNDPTLYLSATAAESASYDIIDPESSGFIVNNVGFNTSGATYIFLAIA